MIILNKYNELESGTPFATLQAKQTINSRRIPMHRILLTIAACLLVLTAIPALAAPPAPADMRLAPPPSMQAAKAPVDFSHALHGKAAIDCATCHHTWDGKGEIASCATAGCHDQPGKKEAASFYAAFHAKNSTGSCLGCHKDMVRQGRTAPVACKDCHKN
jgi:hypothetical protein